MNHNILFLYINVITLCLICGFMYIILSSDKPLSSVPIFGAKFAITNTCGGLNDFVTDIYLLLNIIPSLRPSMTEYGTLSYASRQKLNITSRWPS